MRITRRLFFFASSGCGFAQLGRYGRREPAGLSTDARIAYWSERIKGTDLDVESHVEAMLSLARAYLQKDARDERWFMA
jgi:hypothetical protein